MEEKIDVIQQTLEINKKEAKTALELADGNLDKALTMVDYVDKNYIIIQGKINYGRKHKIYGLFSVIADGKKGEFLKFDLVLANEKKLLDINLKVKNDVFTKTINNFSSQLTNSSKYYYKLNTKLKEKFNPTEVFELLELVKIDNINEIKNIFKEKIQNILEEQVQLDLHVRSTTKAQLITIYPKLFSKEQSNDTNEDSENNQKEKLGIDITLSCIPIVSPTKGRKLRNLSSGDKILVKVTDTREVGKYLANLLNDSNKGVEGIINDIEFNKNSKRYLVTIKFGPNIYGKIITESEIKLATPEIKTELINNQTELIENKLDKNVLLIFILLGLISILLIILLSIKMF